MINCPGNGQCKIIHFKLFGRRNETKNEIYCETPIPKAKRSGIGKLNNPAKREGNEDSNFKKRSE